MAFRLSRRFTENFLICPKIVQYVRKWPEKVEEEAPINGQHAEAEPTIEASTEPVVEQTNGFKHAEEAPQEEAAPVHNNGTANAFVEEEVNEEKSMPTNYVNLDYLRSISGNDENIIRKAIEKFLDTTPELLNQMGEQLNASDAQALGKSAHKLKSSVA
ncbi:Hpt domain-containing protein, partial [Okeania hirsuta]|uniref:Hpt domain-containing protein n=1 Tax=Okeania hirsuta TaxID=1458930 RepID=UPI00105BB3CC